MTQTVQPPAEKSVGRPRNQRIDAAALEAVRAILDTEGYSGVSFEAVARRAETSRPAIYRRWSSRPALVLDAVARTLEVPGSADTGCTLCDIHESFHMFLAAYRGIRPETLSALYAECAVDSGLRQRYLQTIVAPVRTAVGRTLDRALARGDLRADTDMTLLLDLIASLVHYRAQFSPEHLTDDDAGHAMELILQGAAVDYPGLVAHSDALEAQHDDETADHRHPVL